MKTVLRFLMLPCALALLAGCASGPRARDDAAWAPTPPMAQQVAPVQADGSIYHDSQNMELFTDPRAHRVGDILTVALVESTQATKKASTTTSKTDKAKIASPTVLGHSLSIGGKVADIGLDGERSFDGAGSSSQSNQLTGQITVTVAQRLSNGNLMIRGEKWLTINQGQELVRISGIVRPQDIGQDNVVPSTRVADARISYTGRGTLADANSRGWLSRFFNSKWMPF
ncbi:flagellar basal body L-ring protein FlgH [Rhodanobacter sp. AS-Z3]|uniref:flagellar basal body L-ring protein FlgH n=1 Tax=Rhodanobacter sp. AS-Z3 TaxID=3031330 RepID=UPI00247A5E63|nr:flagellar basal body L-ring protein FlgH [Rhodanobacter sp. AS-Z3]WEN14623.1 flagellar basal body L-ring protein FlgH [Rhodanobacter sp. AS-Z3]